ncbi:Ldh family oxidoreductase [Candidatus Dojkabacteria bacterium]|uniref:Ldh family oxidoreductase n=1 Tax=Candidatus Dojkabacteria bacterium TaxID=2099670 RepID=A0A955L089_9BACT|nr:Ldh family oxidoreductase [Candidatus Dojkabacteria bacterium]
MKVKVSELEKTTLAAVKKYGYTDTEAEIIKNILMYAQLRGNNQGVVKLIGNGIPRIETGKEPTIDKETKVSALLNGNYTHAMVVMDKLVDIAIEKANDIGVGIAGNHDTSESTGALGYYVNKIAEQGLIGIAFASAPFQLVAPYGSNEARFCTNPMAYGIPTKSDPIILDMAMSSMTYYGLIEAKTAGKSIPDEIGYNSKGENTNDPSEVMSGALRAFGGHKGSGLALVVQILAGAFVKADSFDNDSDNAGNLVIAIDPEIFLSKKDFTESVSEIIEKVKSARKVDGVSEIFIPGERGNNFKNEVEKPGEIEIEDNLWKALQEVIKK